VEQQMQEQQILVVVEVVLVDQDLDLVERVVQE
jgi:hypothetical protein